MFKKLNRCSSLPNHKLKLIFKQTSKKKRKEKINSLKQALSGGVKK